MLAVQNSDELIYYCGLLSMRTTGEMHNFQRYFSRTFQVLEFFQEKKSRTLKGGVGTPQEFLTNCCMSSLTCSNASCIISVSSRNS